MRQLLRGLIIQRLLYGRRRGHRGWGPAHRSPWGAPRGYGYRTSRGYGTTPFGFGRPRGRTQVRVGGCCLPIPLGLTALTAVAVQAGRRRS